MKRLLIAGGGTGGHVLAGLAVADEWAQKNRSPNSVLFVGSYGGMEEILVPKAGYALKRLVLGSLNRVSWTRKLKTFFQLPVSLIRSLFILLEFRPNYVLGVGGYASGPIVLVARILKWLGLKSKIAVIEQNRIPGFTNRILSRFVDLIFTAFPGTEDHFAGKKIVHVGNPIRSTFKQMPSNAHKTPITAFIFGGSQGAVGVNTLVIEALPYLKELKGQLTFIHQTGEKDYQRVLQAHQKHETGARVEKFIVDMVSAYQESSFLICRSGSSTLAEIAAVGRASILVPLPTASDNHQEWNAKVFSDGGAAYLLKQHSTSGIQLSQLIRDLIGNPTKLQQMEVKVREFYIPNAAENVVQGFLQE
jgi:UDP-N-acetylglucosamine--N-acetylmuramyl-(pentapeptide) pyrophosphoryl-undecaprenol N-acetylglucosamine transferase